MTAAKSIWFREWTPKDFNDVHEGSFAARCGVVVTEVRPDALIGEMVYRPPGSGSLGILAESLGSIAAWLSVDHAKFTVVGVDINLSSVGTPQPGSTVYAETRPYLMNDQQQLWGVDMRDENGNLLATSRISVMVMPAKG